MKIVNQNSLAATLDTLNELFFHDKTLTETERIKTARWIAGRQNAPRSYASMFAPTEWDYRHGFRLFTGEKIRSGAATGHILGEEACRALILLDVPQIEVNVILDQATRGMLHVLKQHENSGGTCGMYCCGTCTPVLWRHLAAGGLSDNERRLASGMKALKAHRDGKGRWKRFPFYYTLLALSEIDMDEARDEIRYTLPALERSQGRSRQDDMYSQRRTILAQRVLTQM